ncbi:MAG: polyhydroxybutyrate depolymerase [Hyphomicrobiales bacterium]|nr:polyhydroxybutyrate depolymerase [Hyphomicrobiales bacterium]
MTDAIELIESIVGALWRLRRLTSVLTGLTILVASLAQAQAAEKLGAFPIDPAQVSVAGISSGAFMANQLQVAHSADIIGAAMIAGGLYGCAVQDVTEDGVLALASQAVGPCLKVPFLLDDVSTYKDRVEKLAAKAWIDPPANLARAKVYFFTGGSDQVVDSETVAKGKALYDALGVPGDNIVFEDRSGPAAEAGHSWVTKNFGGACDANATPFIDDCKYDQAGAELKAIYGQDLKPPAGAPTGRIVAFDQKEFVPGKATAANGLLDTGYLYVPKACEPGAAEPCRLQVVLHGCKQSAEELGDVFYTKIGVNEWADTNAIVVLYPQAHATTPSELPPNLWSDALIYANPEGCWNWWGYSDDRQYLTKKGVQVVAIWKMIQRLEGR